MADQHAKVVIDGDATGSARAAKQAQSSLAAFDAEVVKTNRSLQQKSASLTAVAASTDKLGAGLKKVAPSIGAMGAAALTTKASLGSMVSVVLQATAAFGPWGAAIGIAGTALVGLMQSQDAAAEAARKHTTELKKQRDELVKASKLGFFEDVVSPERRRAAEERTGIVGLRETERFLEEELARARGAGENLSEILTGQAKARSAVLQAEASIARATLDLERAKSAELESQQVLRADELRLIEEGARSEERKTTAIKRQTEAIAEVISLRRSVDRKTLRAVDDSIVAQAFAQDESIMGFGGTLEGDEAFGALDKQFDDSRRQFETDRLEQLEKARKDAHDADLERIEQEQAATQLLSDIRVDAAQTALAGLLDIAGARRDAIRLARLQGATEREASQAGRIATLINLEAQLKSLRNMAAMHVIEYLAKGAASQASTYGIPNPQSIGYFTAAGIMGGIAVASGVAALGVGVSADNAQANALGRGGGGDPFGRGPGGSSNGGSYPRSGPSPVDSQIPGSPGPTIPTVGGTGGPAANVNHYHFHGDVYGQPRKDFVEQLDRDLAEVGHWRRRSS